jgi:hypothetical protein
MMRALLAVGLALMVSVVNASQAERNDMSRKGVFPHWIERHVGDNVHFFFACRQQRHILDLQEIGKHAHAVGDIRSFHAALENSVNNGVCFASQHPITQIAVDIVDAFKTSHGPKGSHLKYWAVVVKVMNPENHDQFLYAGVDILEPEGI